MALWQESIHTENEKLCLHRSTSGVDVCVELSLPCLDNLVLSECARLCPVFIVTPSVTFADKSHRCNASGSLLPLMDEAHK